MKRINKMNAKEIREMLEQEFFWDFEAMARNFRITTRELVGYLQCGGDSSGDSGPAKPKKASYDVAFDPMVNVEVSVLDPENPTDAEIYEIIAAAFTKICDNAGEKLSPENVSLIRLYHTEEDGPMSESRDHYVVGSPEYDSIDPEILIEVTNNLYGPIYKAEGDGVETASVLRHFARQLTEKYKNVDWHHDDLDFWETMDQECDRFAHEHSYDEE